MVLEEKSLKTQQDYNNSNTRGVREQSLCPNNTLSDKLMIFIDGGNLFHCAKNEGIKIDFEKLVNYLSKGFNLIRVYYYTGLLTSDKNSQQSNKQRAFLDSLAFNLNFDVITKPLININNKIFEKGVDVKIASDIIWHGLSNNYDSFILISGDKDLMDCLIRMKDNGKRVIVANFEGRISRELKKIADEYINLSDNLKDISK